MAKKRKHDPLIRVMRHSAYGSTEVILPRGKKRAGTAAAPTAEPTRRAVETTPPAPAAGTKKPRKPRKSKPSAPVFPQLAGRKSKALVTEKTFLRMGQRHAKMTGARGTLRHLVAKVAWKAHKTRQKRAHAGRYVTKKVFGTKLGRRSLAGVGLAGAAAAAALIIRKRRKRR